MHKKESGIKRQLKNWVCFVKRGGTELSLGESRLKFGNEEVIPKGGAGMTRRGSSHQEALCERRMENRGVEFSA